VSTDTPRELVPRAKGLVPTHVAAFNARNLLLSDVLMNKGSTRKCIEWCAIHRSGPMSSQSRSNTCRKTTKMFENTREPSTKNIRKHEIAIYSRRLRLATQLPAQPPAQLVESQAAQIGLL
jgi:hypothetical protein